MSRRNLLLIILGVVLPLLISVMCLVSLRRQVVTYQESNKRLWTELSAEHRKVEMYLCDGLNSSDCFVVLKTFRSNDLIEAVSQKKTLLSRQ